MASASVTHRRAPPVEICCDLPQLGLDRRTRLGGDVLSPPTQMVTSIGRVGCTEDRSKRATQVFALPPGTPPMLVLPLALRVVANAERGPLGGEPSPLVARTHHCCRSATKSRWSCWACPAANRWSPMSADSARNGTFVVFVVGSARAGC
jgi:hypothetical protein